MKAFQLTIVMALFFCTGAVDARTEEHTEVSAAAPIKVVCTLGILGNLAREVGGERVAVEVLSSPAQDPHYVEPRPTLMRKAREADLFVESGLQLELWAGKVVAGAGNPRIQMGQKGHVVASLGIATLELPSVLSRERGDVHPNGNPHVWLDPVNTKIMAANIAKGLIAVDAAGAESYRANLADYEHRIDEALFGPALIKKLGASKLTRMARSGKLLRFLELRKLDGDLGGWLKKAQPLAGSQFVSYHKTFVYFATRFGMQVPIEVEGKPGLPPTPKHKAAVLELMRNEHVDALMQGIFFDRGASEALCKSVGARLCTVPIDVAPGSVAPDIFALIDLYLDELLLAHEGVLR